MVDNSKGPKSRWQPHCSGTVQAVLPTYLGTYCWILLVGLLCLALAAVCWVSLFTSSLLYNLLKISSKIFTLFTRHIWSLGKYSACVLVMQQKITGEGQGCSWLTRIKSHGAALEHIVSVKNDQCRYELSNLLAWGCHNEVSHSSQIWFIFKKPKIKSKWDSKMMGTEKNVCIT